MYAVKKAEQVMAWERGYCISFVALMAVGDSFIDVSVIMISCKTIWACFSQLVSLVS